MRLKGLKARWRQGWRRETTPLEATRPRGDDAGFSILEVAIAMAILLTVLVSVSSLLATSFKVGANSRFEQEATSIASSTLDDQLANGASTLLTQEGDTALPSVISAGQTYLLEMEITPFDPGTSGCVSPASDPGAMLSVTIFSTWTDQTAGATWWVSSSSASTDLIVQETSLVAVPASAINTSNGSLLVSIQGATNNPVAHLTVTATPTSGSPQTVVTSAGGCALFANLAPSPIKWSLTFGSVPGYVTEQNASSLVATAASYAVIADTTITVSYTVGTNPTGPAYDQAATVNPVYSVPTAGGLHPVLPSNINSVPLSFYSTNLTTSPYVSSSPASVFPMNNVPSYYMVAGSCGVESQPDNDGGVTDGQPVNLTAGSTASPSVPLVPIKIFVAQNTSTPTIVNGATVSASVKNALGTGTDTNCPTTGTTVMPTLNFSQTTTATWTSAIRGRKKYSHATLVSTCNSNCSTSTTMATTTSTVYGAPATLSATVTCTVSNGNCSPVTGTITFKTSGGTTLGSDNSLTSGTGTITYSALPVGTTSIIASYAASGKWQASTAAAKSQVITAAPTTTTLVGNPNPNAYGTSALLTATVDASGASTAVPTGSVTFKNGATNITGCVSVALSSGAANCTLSGLSGGSYSVTAVYTPSPANFVTSTSSTLTQQVTAASTSTALTSSANPSTLNGSVTFTATVTAASGGPAIGSVAFMNGATVLATVALNGSGVATYATAALGIGTTSLTAVFTATTPANFATSTGSLSQVVNAPTGSGYLLCGLPYGVWLLTATLSTLKSSNESVQVVIQVTPSGFQIASGGSFASSSVLTAASGGSVTVYIK